MNVSPTEKEDVYTTVQESILATDLGHHFTLIDEMNKLSNIDFADERQVKAQHDALIFRL